LAAEQKLKIIRDTPSKYHFKTKDDHRVNIEYVGDHLFVTLFKWGTETSLLIDLNAVSSTQHRLLETENRIEIENPDFLLRIYPIDTRSTADFYGDSEDDIQCHNGGLRFELVLKNKRPAMDNSFTFPIISRNLRFSRQPFLTQEDIDAGVSCPLNVEGSYAVYHATKKNNQYMTGKAFHIYRPIAEDALGNKAWCSLHIDGYTDPKKLTITIPQQFLDEAIYPVTIDPDFGEQDIGTLQRNIVSIEENEFRAGSAWEMPAPGGTANWIKAYILHGAEAGGTDCDCKVFINQKDSGGAGTHGQIATAENLACGKVAHWEQFNLAGELIPVDDNILSIVGNSDDIAKGERYIVKYDVNGAIASYYEFQNYGAPESPWVKAAEGTTLDYSIYCNYTEPGWAGKISGITNPAKIMGIPVADIAKVKGIEGD